MIVRQSIIQQSSSSNQTIIHDLLRDVNYLCQSQKEASNSSKENGIRSIGINTDSIQRGEYHLPSDSCSDNDSLVEKELRCPPLKFFL